MTTLHLRAHPGTPCPWIDAITATVSRGGAGTLSCRYVVKGDIGRLLIPRGAPVPARTDGLWRHTCFELFAREAPGSSYREFNFSPSGHWAEYGFDGYRQGMRESPIPAPVVSCTRQHDSFMLAAEVAAAGFGTSALQLAVSAVLEDRDGGICYWALQHPEGKPDFHHDAGFIARI